MSTYNVHIKKWSEGNREITFPVTKGNSYQDTYLRVCSVRELGGGNGLGVYQSLVDAFFMKNGTDATTFSCQLARAATGKKKMIFFKKT